MARSLKLRLVAAALLTAISSQSLANTLSEDDIQRVSGLHRKFLELWGDFAKIGMSMNSPSGVSKEHLCFLRVGDQAYFVDLALYPLVFVVRIASLMIDPADEKVSLEYAALALSELSKQLDRARDEINRIFGSCRQYPLVYDRAKLLMNLVEETRKTVQPMLKRVEAAKQF